MDASNKSDSLDHFLWFWDRFVGGPIELHMVNHSDECSVVYG